MNDLDDRLAAWNPVPAEDMFQASNSADAAQLLHRILNQPATSPARRRAHGPRWRTRAWIAVAAAAAVIVAGIAATVPSQTPTVARQAAGFQRGPSVGVASTEAELVDYATRSAASTPVFVPDPQDWAYFEMFYGLGSSGGPDAVGDAQTWQQVGTSRFAASWHRGKLTYGTGGGPASQMSGWPGPNWTTMYQYLASLPAQPAALRKIILANNHGSPVAAFTAIENLFGSFLMPARFQAELYAVLVSLPGVQFTQQVVDAAGRPGIGLYMLHGGFLDAVIVNPRTYAYMGGLLIAVQGHPSYDALLAHPGSGMVAESMAIVNSGIVSQPGQVP